MYKKSLNESIKELKLEGTILDRRRKLNNKQIRQLLDMYDNKEKLGLTNQEIVDKFNVSVIQIYRYKDYEKYLKRCNVDNKKYYQSKSKEEKREIYGKSNYKTRLYKKTILELKNILDATKS